MKHPPAPTEELVHCIYCSAASAPPVSDEELAHILSQSRENNAAAGLSGMLLYHAGSFFQVLERERSAVERVFGKIGTDPRHTNVVKLVMEPIERRAFGEWTMGYPGAAANLADIPGFNDFFLKGRSFTTLREGRAKNLVRAFREGRWRTSLT